jgi:V/A-type H+/Na+-transporting ATPase subunit F
VNCMASVRMGAVGERDAVLCFKALGMAVIPTATPEETAKALFSLTQRGVKLIFITESTAANAKEAIRRYQTDPQVAIIPIPGSTGSSGYAMSRVKANVEKAIGADILFGNNSTEDV